MLYFYTVVYTCITETKNKKRVIEYESHDKFFQFGRDSYITHMALNVLKFLVVKKFWNYVFFYLVIETSLNKCTAGLPCS